MIENNLEQKEKWCQEPLKKMEQSRKLIIAADAKEYARLARAGINILSVARLEDASDCYIFEYSWNDPTQQGKLHWSKAVFYLGHQLSLGDLIAEVELARKELEG